MGEEINKTLKECETFMITKRHCPYCIEASRILGRSAGEFLDIPHGERKKLEEEIKEEHGHETYPMIYYKGEWIGGCSELKKKITGR